MRNQMKSSVQAGLMIVLLLFSYTIALSQEPEKAILEYPASEQNLNMVKNAMKAYETGDWDLLRGQVSPTAVFYNLGSFDSLTIDKTIEYWQKGRQTAIPDLDEDAVWLPVSVQEGPREGNWVLHWGANTLKYPDGDSIRFPYHVATKIVGNKISEVHFYYDNSKIIRALGYAIDPPIKEAEDQGEIPRLDGNTNQ